MASKSWNMLEKVYFTQFYRYSRDWYSFDVFEINKWLILYIDWLIIYLINYLMDLLVDWLIDWLIDISTDSLIDCWLIDWLVYQLIHWLTVDWLIDWLIDQLIDWLLNWLTDGYSALYMLESVQVYAQDSKSKIFQNCQLGTTIID